MPWGSWMHIQNNCFKILLGENDSTVVEPQMPEVRENVNIIQTAYTSTTFWRSLLKMSFNPTLKVRDNIPILISESKLPRRRGLFKCLGLGQLDMHLGNASLASYFIISGDTVILSICRGYILLSPVDAWPRIVLNSLYILCFFPIHTYLYNSFIFGKP